MDINDITKAIIDASINLHKKFGPGLLESIYEKLLVIELRSKGLLVEEQKWLPLIHKGIKYDNAYRIDLLVNNQVIVEVKSAKAMEPIFTNQLRSYLVLSGLNVGILANFGMSTMKEGLKRIANNFNNNPIH
ncbi:MAG: GxxExxY protein [Kiritimatiellae bacterium]|jgi:iron complex transport system substrate-binding protein|nr:GxxExxY protein [Kiritimatiellia bacterium]